MSKRKSINHAEVDLTGALSRRDVLRRIGVAVALPAALSVGSAASGHERVTIADSADMPSTPLLASAPVARYQHTATPLPGGMVLVAGGRRRMAASPPAERHPPPLSSVQIFDPGSGVWFDVSPMSKARARHAAVALADGRVLVAGGEGAISLASVEIYDPSQNVWLPGEPLLAPRMDHAMSLVDGAIVVTGGLSDGPLALLEMLVPAVAASPLE